jgi:beta-lactamase regulating signal transducer with metallopeptidase domain
VVPATVAIAGGSATAAPSLMAWFGWATDHCQSHSHHLHLCLVHSEPRLWLVMAGAAWLAWLSVRWAYWAFRVRTMTTELAALEALGSSEFHIGRQVVTVPGAPWICHAVGAWRSRIIVSASLRTCLDSDEFVAALAHERAHLERRDPLTRLLLSASGVFGLGWPFRAFLEAYIIAAEEACDALAANAVSDPGLVARALVKVASLRPNALPRGAEVPAFGEIHLERRVRVLLDNSGSIAGARGHALRAGLVVCAALTLVIAGASPSIHHAVETALHLLH